MILIILSGLREWDKISSYPTRHFWPILIPEPRLNSIPVDSLPVSIPVPVDSLPAGIPVTLTFLAWPCDTLVESVSNLQSPCSRNVKFPLQNFKELPLYTCTVNYKHIHNKISKKKCFIMCGLKNVNFNYNKQLSISHLILGRHLFWVAGIANTLGSERSSRVSEVYCLRMEMGSVRSYRSTVRLTYSHILVYMSHCSVSN